MKLIVIGLAATNQVVGGGLVDGLREKGHECIVIASDDNFPWRVSGYDTLQAWEIDGRPTPNYDFHVFSARKTYGGYCENSQHAKALVYGWEPIKLVDILEIMGISDYDAVLLVHTSDFIWDLGGIEKPIMYYFTGDVNRPRWPRNCTVTGFFYGYSDAVGMFRDLYPPEMIKLKFKEFLPNAYSGKAWYANPQDKLEEKKHFLGFMGSMSADRGTWFSQQLYRKRQKYVHYLEKEFALELRPSAGVEKCREFLWDTFMGVNVSCFGVNMRQFEVPACGALLLQYDNMDCAKTGLVNGVNCLIFKNQKQLDAKIEWAFANLDKANQIRLKGIEYARQNTFYHRGLQLAESLNTHLTLFKPIAETGTTPPTDNFMVTPPG